MDATFLRNLIITAALGSGGYYAYQQNQLKTSFTEVDGSVQSITRDYQIKENAVADFEKKLIPLRATTTQIGKGAQAVSGLKAERETLINQIDSMNNELKSGIAELEALIEVNRRTAKGKALPDFKLNNGEDIKKAIVNMIGQGFLSVETADGVLRLPIDELPPALVDRFALDYVEEKAASDSAELSQSAQAAIAASTYRGKGSAQISPEILAIEGDLNKLKQRMDGKKSEARKLERAAYQAAADAGRRGDSGVGTSNPLFAKAKELKAEVKELQGQYRALRNKVLGMRKIKVKLDSDKSP